MDEYIKREAYYKQINDLSKGKHGVYCAAINDCMNALDEQPAADVVPRSEIAKIFAEIDYHITLYKKGHFSEKSLLENISEIKKKYTEE